MSTFATTTALAVKMVGTTFDTATTALASACIVDAENEIKKHLAKQYDLGSIYFTTSIAPQVTSMTETLALGYMYENMSRGSKEGHARADRYIKRVMDNLIKLADGTLQLFDTAGALIPCSGNEWRVDCNTSDYPATFNEDHPRKWKPSSDKLDDIKDEREE